MGMNVPAVFSMGCLNRPDPTTNTVSFLVTDGFLRSAPCAGAVYRRPGPRDDPPDVGKRLSSVVTDRQSHEQYGFALVKVRFQRSANLVRTMCRDLRRADGAGPDTAARLKPGQPGLLPLLPADRNISHPFLPTATAPTDAIKGRILPQHLTEAQPGIPVTPSDLRVLSY